MGKERKMTLERDESTPMLARPVGDRDHTQGPVTAPATLVVYGDYQCPYTRKAYLSVQRVLSRAGGKVRFVFRHYPLSHIHAHAQSAAEAAESASAQGKFWEMSDRLFKRQRALERPQLGQYAADIALDSSRFDREMEERTHAARVLEDFESGHQSGVRQTPTFFVNGVRYAGEYDARTLLAVIEEAQDPAKGAPGERVPERENPGEAGR